MIGTSKQERFNRNEPQETLVATKKNHIAEHHRLKHVKLLTENPQNP